MGMDPSTGADSSRDASGRPTVLVVDDSPVDQRLAGKVVEKGTGAHVLYADNGRDALAAIEEHAPHIVVTDLLMPDMDGLELVAHVRRDHPLVPVVLMTAHGSEETAVQALTAGAASYVPKRSLAVELAETVSAVLAVARGARDDQLVFDLMQGADLVYELGNDTAQITALVRHFESLIRRFELCDDAETIQVGVALREAMVNAIEHGNLDVDSRLKETPDDAYQVLLRDRTALEPYSERRVHVRARLNHDEACWEIRDEGNGFDPTSIDDPTDPLNLDRVWGRGLLLIRTFMTEVSHNDLGNQITMVKRRKSVGPS